MIKGICLYDKVWKKLDVQSPYGKTSFKNLDSSFDGITKHEWEDAMKYAMSIDHSGVVIAIENEIKKRFYNNV